MTSSANTGKGRRQLLMLIALFLLPPVTAYLAWQYVSEHGVGATTNHGHLVTPPRPLDWAALRVTGGDGEAKVDALKGRWVYVMYLRGECAEACQRQLYVTRQTRIGVNKDIPRVRRLLVIEEPLDADLADSLRKEHEDLTVAMADEAVPGWTGKFLGDGFQPDGAQFFLVDPLGNLMMYYPSDVEPKGLLRDLQKLLKTSQVG